MKFMLVCVGLMAIVAVVAGQKGVYNQYEYRATGQVCANEYPGSPHTIGDQNGDKDGGDYCTDIFPVATGSSNPTCMPSPNPNEAMSLSFECEPADQAQGPVPSLIGMAVVAFATRDCTGPPVYISSSDYDAPIKVGADRSVDSSWKNGVITPANVTSDHLGFTLLCYSRLVSLAVPPTPNVYEYDIKASIKALGDTQMKSVYVVPDIARCANSPNPQATSGSVGFQCSKIPDNNEGSGNNATVVPFYAVIARRYSQSDCTGASEPFETQIPAPLDLGQMTDGSLMPLDDDGTAVFPGFYIYCSAKLIATPDAWADYDEHHQSTPPPPEASYLHQDNHVLLIALFAVIGFLLLLGGAYFCYNRKRQYSRAGAISGDKEYHLQDDQPSDYLPPTNTAQV